MIYSFKCTCTMAPFIEMIVHNVCKLQDPDDVRLMNTYITNVLPYCSKSIYRSKQWNDFIFRPRYYFTNCPRTLDLLTNITVREMSRHVISIESIFLPVTTPFLLEVELIVRQLMDAGLYVVGNYKSEAFLMTSSHDVFRSSSVEIIMEGTPFEEEYITNLPAFRQWLTTRLSTKELVK